MAFVPSAPPLLPVPLLWPYSHPGLSQSPWATATHRTPFILSHTQEGGVHVKPPRPGPRPLPCLSCRPAGGPSRGRLDQPDNGDFWGTQPGTASRQGAWGLLAVALGLLGP